MNSRATLYRVITLALLCCSSTGFSQDRLKILGARDGDGVIVMMDSRTKPGDGGCSDDEVFRSSVSPTEHEVGNRLALAGCRSEIAVFSEAHAMYRAKVRSWTDRPGDVVEVPLRRRITVPITIWVTYREAWKQAHDELNNANLIFAQNRVGVRFAPVYKKAWDARAAGIIRRGIKSTEDDLKCTNIEQVRQSIYYRPNRLNVYYVFGDPDDDNPFRGRNCAIKDVPMNCDCSCAMAQPADGDGNITYLSRLANLVTLAHELGHAFGLRPGPCDGHPDPHQIGEGNVMLEGMGSDLNRFTLGQVFRMNTHSDKFGGTMLIRNGLRPKTGRECRPDAKPPECPALNTDWPGSGRAKLSGKALKDFLAARYAVLKEQERADPRYKMMSTEAEFVSRYLE